MACYQHPDFLVGVSVGGHVIEEIYNILIDHLGRENLKTLITEERYWKAFVEAAELSSQETTALYDLLKKHLTQKPTEEERLQREEQKKRVLKEFPQLKSKLEEHIRKLRDLADHLDKVHRACTITNVVSSVGSIASGIGGLLLAPETGMTSLILSEAAVGAKGVSALSNLITSGVEEASRWKDEDEAKRLVGASRSILEKILILFKFPIKIINTGLDLFLVWKTLGQQIHAYRIARANPLNRVDARNVRIIGRTSDLGSLEVENAVANSVRPMTRGARIRAVAFPTIMFIIDGYHLLIDSMDLYKGATTKSGKALRDLANDLEKKVQEFEQTYKTLQSDLP